VSVERSENRHAAEAQPQLILASSSPRRRALLHQIGLRFAVVPAAVDENLRPDEEPAAYVLRVARDKVQAVVAREGCRLPVLGADTAVVLAGRILGKPTDRAEAAAMLALLSGATHEVYSAVALWTPGGFLRDRLNVTRVTFAELEPEWIAAYVESGDPLDKAGAYGVQGQAQTRITRIEGSFSGVMGLPLWETGELLRAAEVIS